MRTALIILASIALPAITTISTNAAPRDACALVTQAQVGAALGVMVKPGSYVTGSDKQACTFVPASPTDDFRSLEISFQSTIDYQIGQQLAAVAASNAGRDPFQASASVSGIGEDAYYRALGKDYTELMVKKGDAAIKIAIHGNLPVEKKQSIEKSLALQALAKM